MPLIRITMGESVIESWYRGSSGKDKRLSGLKKIDGYFLLLDAFIFVTFVISMNACHHVRNARYSG